MFSTNWTAAKLGFLYYLATYFLSQLWRLFSFAWKFTLLDLIHIHTKRLLASHTSQDFSFQFVNTLRCRSEKHGFGWRYQDCGALFCFDGQGEEEEEQGEEITDTAPRRW
jgi:hypothetical protein